MPLLLQLALDGLPAPASERSPLLTGMPADLDEPVTLPFGRGLLQLFYCVTNPWLERERDDLDLNNPDHRPCDEAAYEPFSANLLVRVTRPTGASEVAVPTDLNVGFRTREISGWEAIDDYPCLLERWHLGIRMREFDSVLTEDAASEAFDCYNGDKLGGWPTWCQSPKYPACPLCDRPMRLIFQLASQDHLDFIFSRGGPGLLTQCPEHKEVVTFQIQRS